MNNFIKETLELLDKAKNFLDENGEKIRKNNEIIAEIKMRILEMELEYEGQKNIK